MVFGPSSRSGYVELPYTFPQIFTLFALMQEQNDVSPENDGKSKLEYTDGCGGSGSWKKKTAG